MFLRNCITHKKIPDKITGISDIIKFLNIVICVPSVKYFFHIKEQVILPPDYNLILKVLETKIDEKLLKPP